MDVQENDPGRLAVPSLAFLWVWQIGCVLLAICGLIWRPGRQFLQGFPAIPSWTYPWLFLIVLALVIAVVFVQQDVGGKALEEGRASTVFGMVDNVTMTREMHRAAERGNMRAGIVLWLRVLAMPLIAVFIIWPKA
ncbi:MAG: hypothetical protein NTV73_08205 [Hyphomicrobiales bacterium]|nr:hypothetical protein [Hyphomicrobiales bacterium]